VTADLMSTTRDVDADPGRATGTENAPKLKLPPPAPTDPAPVQEEDELERVALLST